MWRDDQVRHEILPSFANPTEPGAAAMTFRWVQDYLYEHRTSILTLEPGEIACPVHTHAFWQQGKLWLMAHPFVDWMAEHEGLCLSPKLLLIYLHTIGAHQGWLRPPAHRPIPVIRLPNDGTYVFARSKIILRGAFRDDTVRPGSN